MYLKFTGTLEKIGHAPHLQLVLNQMMFITLSTGANFTKSHKCEIDSKLCCYNVIFCCTFYTYDHLYINNFLWNWHQESTHCHARYTTTHTRSYYHKTNELAYNICPIYTKPHLKFEINPSVGCWNNCDKIRTDGMMDKKTRSFHYTIHYLSGVKNIWSLSIFIFLFVGQTTDSHLILPFFLTNFEKYGGWSTYHRSVTMVSWYIEIWLVDTTTALIGSSR